MAYARLSSVSDVYVIACGEVYPNGFACLSCAFLHGPRWQHDTATAAEMITHLLEHRAAGHQVREDALTRLREEAG